MSSIFIAISIAWGRTIENVTQTRWSPKFDFAIVLELANKDCEIVCLRMLGYHTGEVAVFGQDQQFSFVEMLNPGGNFLYVVRPEIGYTLGHIS